MYINFVSLKIFVIILCSYHIVHVLLFYYLTIHFDKVIDH